MVFNERTKLTANWLNTMATALIAAGLFAPAAALLYGLSQVVISLQYMIALAAGCLGLGLCLHFVGRTVLRRLRE